MPDSSIILQLVARKGMVSQEQIVAVKEGLDRKSDDTLFEALVRKGFLERKLVFKALAEEFSMRFVDLDAMDLPKEPSEYLEETLARQFRAFPLEIENGSLQVAISDPLEVESIDSLSHMLKAPIEPVLADGKQIERAINERYYRRNGEDSEGGGNAEIEEADVQLRDETVGTGQDSLDESDAPIIRLVQGIIAEAIR
ncbi:MAG: type II/IV secretion system protein, partial [Opitutales bacterium]|nr:type II/IV secretion system protein [Opitutales bacterium]